MAEEQSGIHMAEAKIFMQSLYRVLALYRNKQKQHVILNKFLGQLTRMKCI